MCIRDRLDAMALAEKYGKNKYVWRDNVENFILLKSNEEYLSLIHI